MLNKSKRILAVLLALILVFALAGCSKTEGDGSSADVEYITDITYVDGENTSGDTTGGNTSGGTTGGNTSGSTTTTNGKVNPADYKGTTIQFAHTFPNFSDDGATGYVVEKFEKEYGIKVELVYCSMDNYANELSGLISAGKAPTVGRSNGDYPACLGYFQSLDAAKIDYTDDIWNQNTFKLTTYNGAPYMCDTVGNYWTELDLVVYSKSALKAANCPTPEELDKAGNWNFDSFLQIGEKLKAKDSNSKGISFHTYDVVLNMAGGSVYKLGSDNYIVNGIDNSTTAIMQKLATAKKGGYFTISGASDLITGSAGIITDHIWSLRNDGDLKNYPNRNDLGFYYLPAYEKGGATPATGIFRGWGIIKGCNENSATGSKAAVAGGIFLRYYLDVNNYDLKNAFLSTDAENFFYEITSFYSETDNYNPYLTYCGLNNGVSGIDPQKDVYTHMNDDPSQIPSQMASIKSKVQNGVDKLNSHIDKSLSAH